MTSTSSTTSTTAVAVPNVLTADATSLMSNTNTLYNIVNSRVSAELNAKVSALTDDYTEKVDLLGAESNRLSTVLGDVMTVTTAFENAQDSLDSIETNLDTMAGLTYDAIKNNGADNTYAREQFDAQWTMINDTADSYSQEFNPIGNVSSDGWTPNVIEYYDDTTPNKKEIQGVYSGTAFKISLADGSTWEPQDGLLQLVNADGQPNEDYTASMTSGVSLVSWDATTNAISVKIKYQGDAPELVVSGTLDRGGLQVMPSWFYDSDPADGRPALSTDADKALALKDLNNAQALLQVNKATVDAGHTQTLVSQNKVNAAMDDNTAQQQAAMKDTIAKRTELQNTEQAQAQAVLAKLSSMSSQQQLYANIFASSVQNDPFVNLSA